VLFENIAKRHIATRTYCPNSRGRQYRLEGVLALHVKVCGHVLIVVVGWAFGLLLVKHRDSQ
jgi:hypothetical protein